MMAIVRKRYSQLSVRDRFIYEILTEYDYANAEGFCKGFIFPSIETIAREYTVSASSVYRSLKKLRECGLISVRRRQNRSACIYILDLPEDKFSTLTNERRLSIPTNEYRNNENIRNIANRLEFLKVLNEDTVARLVAWGYTERQAVQDCVRFGIDELYTQLSNLSAMLAHGLAVREPAKWLNWAIRSRKRIDSRELEAAAARFQRLTAPKRQSPEGEWVFDEQNRTCQWMPRGVVE